MTRILHFTFLEKKRNLEYVVGLKLEILGGRAALISFAHIFRFWTIQQEVSMPQY